MTQLMELRQLRYFIKLAEVLNYSAASRELFITQSTLSQQIINLEGEFGVRLFNRNSHAVSLTPAGEVLLPLAQATLDAADRCRKSMEKVSTIEKSHIIKL